MVDERLGLPFPIACIGASAGGLEAFTQFFDAMPPDSGIAFVLIQHLPPERESLLAEIISRHTAMAVHQVEEGMPLAPDTVYVTRPGHTLTLNQGAFHLGDPVQKRGHRRPVDDFFRSLAEEQKERAIGIIFSGMGTNGTAGAQAIKEVGGLCLAQDPDSAQFPSMPRSLIYAGHADHVLAPAKMPELLLNYVRHPYMRAPAAQTDAAEARPERQSFNEILAILRTQTGRDFSGYKRPTLLRRIQRRMGLAQVVELEDYANVLQRKPEEAVSLAHDLMIHVTGFFRDPQAWEALRTQVVAPLFASREENSPIRAWVTACASGEEAYTLAMLFCEEAQRLRKRFDIKIFATDLAERSLTLARAGVFPGGIEGDLSPERLERFFEKEEHIWRVRKEIREMVVFAPQNLLADPPFSRLDICTCRNLLIYLEPPMQQRVIALLHFALREGGCLFLGASETVGPADGRFEIIDKKGRLFRRMGVTRHGAVDFQFDHALAASATGANTAGFSRPAIEQLVHRTISDYFLTHLGERVRSLPKPTEPAPRSESTEPGASASEDMPEVRRIEEELHTVREELQSTIEELESRNEALRFSNEEVTSINEELQSTNEELETSKEEMQSLNEELTTVNNQLQAKIEELEDTTNDLTNLLSSTDIAVIFLDTGLRIRRYTPAMTDLLELIPSDTGRPIGHLAPKFEGHDLVPDAQAVLNKLVPIEREIRSHSGRWYQCRTLPYRTTDNRIDGVVVTFVDVTYRRSADDAVRENDALDRRHSEERLHQARLTAESERDVALAAAKQYAEQERSRDDP